MAGNYADKRAALADYAGSSRLRGFLARAPVLPENQLFEFIANGAEKDLSVANGSLGSPVKYKHTTATGQVDFIERFTIVLIDNTQLPTKFGGLNALPNGMLVQTLEQDGTVIQDYSPGRPLKNNAHFGILAGVDNPITAAAGDDLLQVRWTMGAAGGSLMLLSGQSFQVTVRDDLTLITELVWMAQGRTFTEEQVLKAINVGGNW